MKRTISRESKLAGHAQTLAREREEAARRKPGEVTVDRTLEMDARQEKAAAEIARREGPQPEEEPLPGKAAARRKTGQRS
jgi:hypothetical protein